MRKIAEVLRLKFEAKLSHEKIARAVGLSKGAVNKYVNLAQVQGLSWPLAQGMDEAALEARLYPPRTVCTGFAEPDYPHLHQELKRKGVTLQLLWSEYMAVHGERAWRYSQFCHHYRQWRKRQKRSMRQLHRAGEKLFIDYCGPTVPIVDAATGEVRQAQVFVAVLGASNYTYAEATWTQSLPDWIASHQRAFQFFGGTVDGDVTDGDGQARLAGAGGLHHERLALLLFEALADALERFVLIQAIAQDFRAGGDRIQGFALTPLANQVLQAGLGVEAVEPAGRVVLRRMVIPDPDIMSIGIEDHRAPAVHSLQAIGIVARLVGRPLSASTALFLASMTARGWPLSPHNT